MRHPTLLAFLALAWSPLAATAQPGIEAVVVKAVAHFDFDSAAVRPADRQTMMAEVARMSNVTWQTVTATGHTDSVGPVAYNQRLSQRRAQAVRAYLLSKGLEPSMVTVEGKASDAPVADNADESGRASNRRTDLEFRGVRNLAAK